jgi:hypothetical protein
VNKFKELRSAAISTLKDIASQLVKRGEYYGTAESRKTLILGRSPILERYVGIFRPISELPNGDLD